MSVSIAASGSPARSQATGATGSTDARHSNDGLNGATVEARDGNRGAARAADSPCLPRLGARTPKRPDYVLCGVERWAVKTLTDPEARLINFHPRATTVSALRRLAPTGLSSRGPGVERRTYRIRARLVEAKLEEDEDYHLVVADHRHPAQTMIVEFPSANCTRRSLHRRQLLRARASLVRSCGPPSSSSFTQLARNGDDHRHRLL
jgi:hypothetical protein